MVYLNNDTNQQEVWIPRNDGLGATHKSSYDQGFEDGYASGETHQKNLLTTTAFTENGEYQRENGWSGVTVDVPQTGHTDQELEDAFESGYTSGQTDQKNLLTTTAFTENGSYQRENGWSGVTVNIDTASTYNSGYTSGYTDGQGSLSSVTFTANTAVTVSDGGYSAITVNVPQTGTTAKLEEKSVSISADTTYIAPTPGYDGMSAVTVDASGYAQTNYDDGFEDGFEDGYSSGSTDEKAKLSGITFTANTAVTLSDGGYSAVTVNVPQTGSSIPLSSITLTANTAISVSDKAYTGITVNVDTASTYNHGYEDGVNDIVGTFTAMTATTNGVYGSSAHPLSSITVDVTTTASDVTYVEYLETDGSEISWDTGVKLEDPSEIVYFDFAPLTGSASGDAYFPFLSQQYLDNNWNLAIRTIGGGYNVSNPYQTRFGDAYQMIQYSVGNKNVCVISVTGATVNGVDYLQQATGLYTVDWNIIINGQKKSDGFMRFPVGRYYGFKIMSGETAVIDLKPALDGNDVPCFYDEVSKTYIYHTGSGTPIAGPIVHYSDYMSGFTDGYASGFTDGYNSGYTDGQDNIIGTFTAMTATTNGVYGSSANPLSSITVNVPQTGSAAVTGVISITGNGIYYSSSDNLDGYSAVTVNVQAEGYGELIGLYCTNNCQFVITPATTTNLINTEIAFGIRSGNASMKITSGASLPNANRIIVDNNGNVTGNSYSYGGSGGVSTGSGQTSVVLNSFPNKNYMYIDRNGANSINYVNSLSASTCNNYSSTPGNNMLLSIDDGYFYIGYFNAQNAYETAACLFPHVDTDGNACIRGNSYLFYPISGECYPIYKNGNNYYVLMKTQPWNQQ